MIDIVQVLTQQIDSTRLLEIIGKYWKTDSTKKKASWLQTV